VSDVWTPGTSGPLDDLVTRIHLRIEAFVAERGERALVEVELRDGPTAALRSISAEPGSGFVTLRPHSDEGGDEEWIVPVAALARITLRSAGEREPFGFSLPDSR
jgi:hypothetical protein